VALSDSTPGYDCHDTLRSVVTIEILPEDVTTDPSSLSTIHHPRSPPLLVFDATSTSRSSVMAHSLFTVLRDGQTIHTETADIKLLRTLAYAGVSDADRTFCCIAPLVPKYWGSICRDIGKSFTSHGMGEFPRVSFPKCPLFGLTIRPPTDLDRYSIIHDIYQHSGSAAESSGIPGQDCPIHSVEYRLTYPESPHSSAQLSSTDSLSSTNTPRSTPYNSVSRIPYLPRHLRT